MYSAAVLKWPYTPHLVLMIIQSTASSQPDMEEKGRNGETALTLAVQAGLEENVRILLEHGALPHNLNSRKESPLLLGEAQLHCGLAALSMVPAGTFHNNYNLSLFCPSGKSQIVSNGVRSHLTWSCSGSGLFEEVDGTA